MLVSGLSSGSRLAMHFAAGGPRTGGGRGDVVRTLDANDPDDAAAIESLLASMAG